MDITKLPVDLRKLIDGYTFTKDEVGMSGADIYRLDKGDVTLYLKVTDDCEIMQWLSDKLPVPEVIYFDGEYLLMTAVDGEMAWDSSTDLLREPIIDTIQALADGIKMLWTVDITDCPFSNRLDKKLAEALYNVEHDEVNPDAFDDSNIGRTPEEIYEELIRNRPSTDELTFTHGDYCPENIFVRGDKMSGLIDFDRTGIADKWQDIGLCVRSIRYHTDDEDYYIARFFEYLGIEPDWKKIEYYILLDELY